MRGDLFMRNSRGRGVPMKLLKSKLFFFWPILSLRFFALALFTKRPYPNHDLFIAKLEAHSFSG